jgi:ABC-type oligopeptide transport system substrate-binding subunit
MSLEAVPFKEFNQRLADGNFDAVLMEMVSGYSVSRSFNFWGSSGLFNFFTYHNPTVDTAFEGVRRAPGDAEYRNAFRRFQQATMEDPPAIFLAWGETARAVNRRFEVVKSPGGDIRMTISDWRLAARPAGATN